MWDKNFAFQMFEQKSFFNHQKNKEIQSPEDKIPVCPVPKSGQKPNHKQVKEDMGFFTFVSTEYKHIRGTRS